MREAFRVSYYVLVTHARTNFEQFRIFESAQDGIPVAA